jgi:hypothetical protein
MIRVTTVLLAFSIISPAGAGITNYADVKANGGVPLSAAELGDLLPGAKVTSWTQAGSRRTWQNKPDGSLAASTDGRGVTGGKNAYATAGGSWRVTDNGRWCVTINWPDPYHEDWCRLMFKVGGRYYGVGKPEDGAPASEFEIGK